MPEDVLDGQEFTDEQLRAALRRVGQEARQTAFAAGYPVIVIKGMALVALYPDGREEILEPLRPEAETVHERS
ncbi:MAG TPA: hypothetical protein VMG10_21385 [Gemmataceae bacterium]|nr:hypothetical protein [Gemmataceae bacterium]